MYYRQALEDIFDLCDLDNNGTMSKDEFNWFNLRTSGEELGEDEWEVVEGKDAQCTQITGPIISIIVTRGEERMMLQSKACCGIVLCCRVLIFAHFLTKIEKKVQKILCYN